MASWQVLEPTIRAPKSEIWVVWNPRDRDSPVHKMFRENPPPRSKIVELNWSDNPKFPAVLDEQRKTAMQRLDPSTYAHIWEGAFYEQSEAQIFRGKYTIDEFTPTHLWDGPYYGMDFGFAVDPTTVVKCWVADNRLYIEQEAYKVGLELDDTTAYVKERMDGIDKYTIRADNARPESISYLKRAGLYGITPCEKGKGSVMDGIEFIKSFEKVVIHPQCKHTQDEFRLYSYKTDRLSGDVLPMPLDSNNHIIDALRYALEPIMKTKSRNYGSML